MSAENLQNGGRNSKGLWGNHCPASV